MKTYLIFFGKSQYFTSHAFDSNDYIQDFNSVIKDFDLLESKLFTVDSIDNKEILAKYNFSSRDGKKYSLLKLYSFAQAFSGDRIAGSIYGVALLSEAELTLSKINLNILSSAKSNFAKLCLNGFKFKSSDFYDEAHAIWNAFKNHDDGNYLDKVTHSNRKVSNTNNISKGFFVKDLFSDAIELDSQMNNTSRIYLSEDLAHLKRSHDKWGNDLKIYAKVNNSYEIYQEPKPIEEPRHNPNPINTSSNTSSEQKLKYKISDLEEENQELVDKIGINKRKHKRSLIQLGALASLFFLTTISFFFKTIFSNDKETDSKIDQVGTVVAATESVNNSSVNIDHILANSNSIDSLISFAKSASYIEDYQPKLNTKDSLKFYKSFNLVQGKSELLKIDIALLEGKFLSKKKILDSISSELQKKKIKDSIEAKTKASQKLLKKARS
jgi:hypothetical protein